MYQVHEIALIAGVSVRTLHHYDQIGLLIPKSVNTSGYREYDDDNLATLQQIMFYKEIGFSLNEIRDLLKFDRSGIHEVLLAQKELLIMRKNRLELVIDTVEKTLENFKGDKIMNEQNMFSAFDMSQIEAAKKEYYDEAKNNWSGHSAWKESQGRTRSYDKAKWKEISDEASMIYSGLYALIESEPGDEEVQNLIGLWKNHITKFYYECTVEIFKGLGELYVNDPRFTANIDKFGKGLAQFMSSAIGEYCKKAGTK